MQINNIQDICRYYKIELGPDDEFDELNLLVYFATYGITFELTENGVCFMYDKLGCTVIDFPFNSNELDFIIERSYYDE